LGYRIELYNILYFKNPCYKKSFEDLDMKLVLL
jgi:hypothetical protein